MILIDTNAALYDLQGKLADPLPSGGAHVSIITEIELLGFPGIREAEVDVIGQFLSKRTVLGLDRSIAAEAIRLRQATTLKLPDAVIAATAIVHSLELWTNDLRLAQVPGVTCRRLTLKNPS